MGSWFTHPMVKNLLPLASSSSMRGFFSSFTSPKIFMGANALPEAPAMGANAITAFAAKCPQNALFEGNLDAILKR